MNPRKDITEAVTAAMRREGFRGAQAHPSVNYDRKRVLVTYLGGPGREVIEAVLDTFVASGVIKRYEVYRIAKWTCGATHDSATHAFFAHEGRDVLEHVDGPECELGCDHGVDMVSVDKLAHLVAAGATFVSTECVEIQ